jgi:hypothetical protein
LETVKTLAAQHAVHKEYDHGAADDANIQFQFA